MPPLSFWEQAPRSASVAPQYSPYGKIEYDTYFEMIDAVLIEMTNDSRIEMIYDPRFDKATVSLRPQVIKKLLPEPAQEWLTSRQNRTCFVGSGKKQA